MRRSEGEGRDPSPGLGRSEQATAPSSQRQRPVTGGPAGKERSEAVARPPARGQAAHHRWGRTAGVPAGPLLRPMEGALKCLLRPM